MIMLKQVLLIFVLAFLCSCTSPGPQTPSERTKLKEYTYVKRWHNEGSFQRETLNSLSDPESFNTTSIRAHRTWDRAQKLLWDQSFTRQLQLGGMETEVAPVGNVIN